MTNKCEICKNKEICKYKEGYKSLADKIKEMFKDTKADEVLSVELDCKYFNKEESMQTAPENKNIDYELFYHGYQLTNKNKCEGCPTYERIKRGEFVVGDQCTYCQNSPTKVTCNCNCSCKGE